MAGEICDDKARMVSTPTGAPAFCYSDQTTHLVNQVHHGFESNPSEIMGFPTGMEMIGFPKNHMFGKSGNSSLAGPSSSKVTTINESTPPDFYHGMSESGGGGGDKYMIMGGSCNDSGSWHDQNRMLLDDSSIRCVFPCEGNERPSQGLSLSLSSNHPSSIGLQSFELRQTNQSHMMNANQIPFQMRNSKFLAPAQEILNEFCSLGIKQMDHSAPNLKSKNKQFDQFDDENGSSSSSRKQQSSLYSLDLMESQKRKSKLLSMLEEVDRRYKHYCDQMKAVVSSFEAVAGAGAASVYSALASKAMSRHFRCLRDGIVSQIQATRKAMGEKDPAAPGTTRGETPRLRILDQTLRQQRAFQQMTMMESHPWRPQRGLPERSVSVLRAWLFEHFLHPYPSDVDKHILARQTGLSRSQVSNWFINARVRLWKPMVEEMYLEELKEQENNMASDSDGIPGGGNDSQIPFPDQKPTADQLVRVDSECLSSIISTNDRSTDPKSIKPVQNHYSQQGFGSYGGTGSMELDFSTYNHHAATGGGVSFSGDQAQNFNNAGGGVSLTLGLQQHGGSNGAHMGFSSGAQSSLFYSRDHMEDCQQVQYSMLDGDQGHQHLPYRNLMGAQLLHDLAG